MVTGLDRGGDWMGGGKGGPDFVWTLMCRDLRSEGRAAFGAVEERPRIRVLNISLGRPEVTPGMGGWGAASGERRGFQGQARRLAHVLGACTHGDGLRLWRGEGWVAAGGEQRRRLCLARGEGFWKPSQEA